MQFRFEPLHATQAAAVLVKLAGNKLNYTKLLKLLYLADRQSLLDTGSPITGSRVNNMKNGPVLQEVYDCIKHFYPAAQATWEGYIVTKGFDLELVKDPGDSELSDYEVDLLRDLYTQHRGRDWWGMIRFVHELPEWESPGNKGSVLLTPEEILRAAGADEEFIESATELNESLRFMSEKCSMPL